MPKWLWKIEKFLQTPFVAKSRKWSTKNQLILLCFLKKSTKTLFLIGNGVFVE